jgi:hypothetical protein
VRAARSYWKKEPTTARSSSKTGSWNLLLGRFFASTHATLREIGERLGVRRLVNVMGCPIR